MPISSKATKIFTLLLLLLPLMASPIAPWETVRRKNSSFLERYLLKTAFFNLQTSADNGIHNPVHIESAEIFDIRKPLQMVLLALQPDIAQSKNAIILRNRPPNNEVEPSSSPTHIAANHQRPRHIRQNADFRTAEAQSIPRGKAFMVRRRYDDRNYGHRTPN